MKPIKYFTHTNFSHTFLKLLHKNFTSVSPFPEWLFNRGIANGYIVLPHNHPLAKLGNSYETFNNTIDFPVHGGFTFAEYAEQVLTSREWCAEANLQLLDLHPKDLIIGFDTTHPDDSLNKWTTTKVEKHLQDIINHITTYHSN